MQPTFPLLLALALTSSVLCQTATEQTIPDPTTPKTSNNGVTTTTTALPSPTTTTTKPVSNTLLVKALRVENPSGKVANGNPCSEFDFAGVPCKMVLSFGASLNGSDCQPPTDTAVTVYGNSGDLDYIAIEIPQTDGVFAGFSVCATLTTADGKQIDTFLTDVGASQQQGIMAITQPSGASVKFAWKSHVPPATPAPPVTTQATATTNFETEGPKATTPEPVFASDCDGFPDRISGTRTVYIANGSIDVYCQYGSNNGSLMVIQSRGEIDDIDFNRTVEEYKSSFGSSGIGKNFWLGLDNMHNLTNSKNYNLYIEVCCGSGDGTVQMYQNFTIGSKDDGYRLNGVAIGQSIGKGLDLKSVNNLDHKDLGQQFSTYDTYESANNGTDWPEFCEVLYQGNDTDNSTSTGGWWFGNCANNLNGAYLKTDDDSKCMLTDEQLLTEGTGIEFKLDAGIDPATGSALTKQTFTRVRMAVYDPTYPLFGFPTTAFCSGL